MKTFIPAYRLPPTAYRRRSSFSAGRSAFTLVELLVVITIIGMLMALLLPAVNNARENGRRVDCVNNIRQLAIALRSYEARSRELPGYANFIPVDGVPQGRLATWTIKVMPFIERNDVWSKWKDSTIPPAAFWTEYSRYSPSMELLVCKSDPPEDPSLPNLSYVANSGIPDINGTTSPPQSPAAMLAERTANGVFFDRYSLPVAGTFDRLTMSLDHIPDGTSNTIMLSENVQADKYTSGYAENPQDQKASVAERGAGFTWWQVAQNVPDDTNPSGDFAVLRINVGKDDELGGISAGELYKYARPSSRHSGGVNVAMCGGEVFFLREDIEYKVYEQLMTSNGAKSLMQGFNTPNNTNPNSNINYILNDADYK